MPNRPASRICDKCRQRYVTRFCPSCHKPDDRPSPSARGYDNEWKKIREDVLRQHGIPESEWPNYDIDHRPTYNQAIEPDHRRYQLTPLLHGEHSQKTALEDTPRALDGSFALKDDKALNEDIEESQLLQGEAVETEPESAQINEG